MKITKTIVIDKPASDVWKVVGEDFDQAYQWMSPVIHSHAIEKQHQSNNAPMKGRICEFSDKPNGVYAEEFITNYDEKEKTINFDVIPKNTPALMPIRKNQIQISVKALGPNQSEVIWTSVPDIKTFGILLSPLLKMGLGNFFTKILGELKTFTESTLPPAPNAA
ncbi:SRPBCC family protein [Aliikangiella coralliicola]|uniref:SRPBCC family protein n=1 Tax=Aliikangiella coralliicola TaxID=2592383 RepID=A0A545UJ87_9GAMM|nr:SRPBCC family protein [Aliikangiella coralliicola]TQV89530.1 SRPBCC family protein [Aliikangiella coralliicola]